MVHGLKVARQRGMTMVSILLIVIVLGGLGVLLAQVIPTYIEFQGVKRAVDKAKTGSSPAEIRSIFDKAMQVEDIRAITGKDLEIAKVGDGNVVKFDYVREIHLGGPAYLTMKYNGQSK
ncbi:MAG TPA: DUF4845 domain-containing protein [Ramlibacter sp.]|nr:DUF4845 domain-containing protein [Ramlibacter sp.]